MNFLATGDWHLRAFRPRSRKDDYRVAQKRKIRQINKLAQKHDCQGVFQPGDLFDGATPPYWLVRQYLKIFHPELYCHIYTVYGQHDQRYHSNKTENTPLAVLEAGERVTILGAKPTRFAGGVDVYGKSWNETIPEIKDPDRVNILVLHEMVIAKKLWEEQEEYTLGSRLLRDTGFDLIVSGDNHHPFTVEHKGRFLVNCGSLMRTNSDQVEHTPRVYIYNVEARSLKEVMLDVEPAEAVFDVEGLQQEREYNEELEQFVRTVHTEEELDLDFLGNLKKLAEGADEDVSFQLDRILEMTIGEDHGQ